MSGDGKLSSALHVLERLEAAGFEAALVGGIVRSLLAGLPVEDVDISASASTEDLAVLFPWGRALGPRGMDIFLLPWGNDCFEVFSYAGGSLEGDLKRRDLTVNALALRRTGEVVGDPGAVEDVARRVLRFNAPGEERLREDPLRALRLARFASSLPGFAIDPDSLLTCRTVRPPLRDCAGERRGREIRLGLEGQAHLFLDALRSAGLLDALFGEECPDDGQFDVLRNRMERLASWGSSLPVRAAALFCRADASFPDDEGSLRARGALTTWRWSNALVDGTAELVHHRTVLHGPLTPEAMAHLYMAKGENVLEDLFQLALVSAHETALAPWSGNRALFVTMVARSACGGDVLPEGGLLMERFSLAPGPDVGDVLRFLRAERLMGRVRSKEDALAEAERFLRGKRAGRDER